jgi:hypothetical protein
MSDKGKIDEDNVIGNRESMVEEIQRTVSIDKPGFAVRKVFQDSAGFIKVSNLHSGNELYRIHVGERNPIKSRKFSTKPSFPTGNISDNADSQIYSALPELDRASC